MARLLTVLRDEYGGSVDALLAAAQKSAARGRRRRLPDPVTVRTAGEVLEAVRLKLVTREEARRLARAAGVEAGDQVCAPPRISQPSRSSVGEGTGMTTVEVVITVRVPDGTDVAEVTETVASWSAPLDAAVGWRVVAVEGIEPLASSSRWW